jgi:hypothetical protein
MSDKHKAWLLLEIKAAVFRSRQTTLDIEAIGLALAGDLITPFEAIAMMYGRDCFGFFGKDQQDELERTGRHAAAANVRGGLDG